MQIWNNIFRKVQVLLLIIFLNWSKRFLRNLWYCCNWATSFKFFCLLCAPHKEIASFSHPHTLSSYFILLPRSPSDLQYVYFITVIYLFISPRMLALSILECCIHNTGIVVGTEKATDKYVLNEWMSQNLFVNNFFWRYLSFKEAPVSVRHST